MWEKSFVAVSVLCGGSVDDALAALGCAGAAHAAEIARELRDPRRLARAQALAAAAQEIAHAIEEITLR